jgi:hypothetical protein
MGPFGIPWSTFAAFLVVLLAIVLALAYAAWDRIRESREEGARGADEGGDR